MSWWNAGWPYGLALVSLACTLTGTFTAAHVLLRRERRQT
jgi:hypothetical protein